MTSRGMLALAALIFVAVGASQSFAACPGSALTNGTTANADGVMAWLNCKAPLDSPVFSGQVGIAASPVAPYSGSNLVDLGGNMILQNVVGNQALEGNNVYHAASGNWTYIANGAATGMRQYSGDIVFHLAPSGTANTTVSGWDTTAVKLVIKNSGDVGIGTAAPGARLSLGQTGSPQQVFLTYQGGNDKRGIGNDLALGAYETSFFTVDSGSNAGGLTFGKMSGSDGVTYSPLVTIRNGGNVGVGTTSPDKRLEAHFTDSSTSFSDPYSVGGALIRNQDSTNGNAVGLHFCSGAGDCAGLYAVVTGSDNSDLQFYTANGSRVVRMTVKDSGNVGIATNSPSYTLHVNGSVAGTSAYNNLSDVRLKKNVTPIRNALTRIDRLQGVYFDWRRPGERSIGKGVNLPVKQRQIGFLAQDLGKVLPEAVSVANDRDRTMSVSESKIVPLLVEAIKELKTLNVRQADELRRLRQMTDRQSRHIGALNARIGAVEREGAIRTVRR